MSIIIDLTITGLIALVPNVANRPSELTAYLVNESDHSQGLTITGDGSLRFEPGDGSVNRCYYLSKNDEKVIVKCDLDIDGMSNTDVSIARQTKRPVKSLSPSPQRPIPSSVKSEEKFSLNWLVRMSNIDRSTGRVKSWTDLENGIVGARLAFGWETASVAEVDGEEAGEVAEIGFRDTDENPISLVQAVAESIRFEVPLDPGPLVVTLFDRKSRTSRSITGNCAKAQCVSIELSNNYTGPQLCEDGDHFRHFYALVRSSGQEMLPYSTKTRKCDKMSTETWKAGRPKVLDRLICPPVLLEP